MEEEFTKNFEESRQVSQVLVLLVFVSMSCHLTGSIFRDVLTPGSPSSPEAKLFPHRPHNRLSNDRHRHPHLKQRGQVVSMPSGLKVTRVSLKPRVQPSRMTNRQKKRKRKKRSFHPWDSDPQNINLRVDKPNIGKK